MKPALLIDHPNYAEAATAGYFIRNADGTGPLVRRFWGGDASFIDFTNPGARRWWIDKIKSTLLDRGVEGIWNDNCEFSIYDSDAICEGDGRPYPGGGLKTIQTNLMNRTAHEAVGERDPNRRPWVVSRAGWASIQQFAQTWSGDNTSSWHELKWNIPMELGMGLSGVANESHDVGGFCGPKPEPELLVRWCQAGIFMPRFTIHSSGEDMTEPWSYPEMTPHGREAMRFRYRLIPLIYSLFDESRRTGAPIQRPMPWHFPDDPSMWDQNFQFLFGEHLLIAPVTESGARTWPVCLPAGHDWIDWNTCERFEG